MPTGRQKSPFEATIVALKMCVAPCPGLAGSVAGVVLRDASAKLLVVVPAGVKHTLPPTIQFPALNESDVTFAAVPDVRLIEDPDPTLDDGH